MNGSLCKPCTHEEVIVALRHMRPHKVPRLDDMNPFFYQRFWDAIGDDVATAVLAILNGHLIPPKLNHTHITLIPKKPNSDSIMKFYPINLCNEVYKLITKAISNRLIPLPPSIISDTQGACT